MTCNVGKVERIVRLIIGVMILGFYGALPSPWRYFTLIGLLPLGSASLEEKGRRPGRNYDHVAAPAGWASCRFGQNSPTCSTRLRQTSSQLLSPRLSPTSRLRCHQKPRRVVSSGGASISTMGLGRVELPTSRLSGVRSNHLSYRPQRKCKQ
jgi:hypothetical protein